MQCPNTKGGLAISSSTHPGPLLIVHVELSVDVRHVGDLPVSCPTICISVVHTSVLTSEGAVDQRVFPGLVVSSGDVVSEGKGKGRCYSGSEFILCVMLTSCSPMATRLRAKDLG